MVEITGPISLWIVVLTVGLQAGKAIPYLEWMLFPVSKNPGGSCLISQFASKWFVSRGQSAILDVQHWTLLLAG